MIPPEVVLMRASSTVFVKASSLVNLDFGAIVWVGLFLGAQAQCARRERILWWLSVLSERGSNLFLNIPKKAREPSSTVEDIQAQD